MTTPQELTNYYKALLIVQYANKSRALGTVDAFVSELIASNITLLVQDGFDLNTAIGAQLDLLATYRNASRIVYGFDPSRSYLALPQYGDVGIGTKPGLITYADNPDSVVFLLNYQLAQQAVYFLTDDELRALIKFNALVQKSDLTVGDIDDILFATFGAGVELADNLDMSIEYTGDGSPLFSILDQINGLPKPAAVALTVA